jgi:F0F1-type ATP synthase assembly protein I
VGSLTPDKKSEDRGDWGRALRDVAPYLGMGTALAVTVLLGLAGGYWLDGQFGTRPLFFLLGGAFGLFAALYHFFKTVTGLNR